MTDQVLRQGIGAEIPGVSKLLDPVISPATGEPLVRKQKLGPFKVPQIGGSSTPFLPRILPRLEEELLEHDIALFRGRRTPIAEFPVGDIPKEFKQEAKIKAGKIFNKLGMELINTKKWKNAQKVQRDKNEPKERRELAFEKKKEALNNIFLDSIKQAVAEIEKERDVKIKQIVTPFRRLGLPSFLLPRRERVEVLERPER